MYFFYVIVCQPLEVMHVFYSGASLATLCLSERECSDRVCVREELRDR